MIIKVFGCSCIICGWIRNRYVANSNEIGDRLLAGREFFLESSIFTIGFMCIYYVVANQKINNAVAKIVLSIIAAVAFLLTAIMLIAILPS